MRSYWFGDVAEDGCTGADLDPGVLVRRLVSIRTDPEDVVPPDWRDAVKCGAVKDRAEYLERLGSLCIRVARERVATALRAKDTELIRMVMVLEGMDRASGQLAERLADWYRVLHPGEGWKYERKDSRRVLGRMQGAAEGPLKDSLDGIIALREVRGRLAGEISDRSERVLPNCSGLVGGLVAARLVALAGGLEGLARLPASSIQVLGARGALFSHLTRGTPPPKHGIIYQHQRVHNAPRTARGRVARVLAGRLAIAARIDLYRGVTDEEFIREADRLIGAAGGRG